MDKQIKLLPANKKQQAKYNFRSDFALISRSSSFDMDKQIKLLLANKKQQAKYNFRSDFALMSQEVRKQITLMRQDPQRPAIKCTAKIKLDLVVKSITADDWMFAGNSVEKPGAWSTALTKPETSTTLPASTTLPIELYNNLSCPFECTRHGRVNKAEMARQYAQEHLKMPNGEGISARGNRRLLLVGDSTIRQIFIALGSLFWLQDRIKNFTLDCMEQWPCHNTPNCIRSGPYSGLNFDLTVEWQRDPFPTTRWIPAKGREGYREPLDSGAPRKKIDNIWSPTGNDKQETRNLIREGRSTLQCRRS